MLNEVDPAANRSTANGTATVFPYTFRIVDETHVEVLIDLTVKTVNVDYVVSGVGDSGGGNITFFSPPANNSIVTRLRKQPASQTSDYQNAESFPAERIERDYDKLAMQVQQIKEVLHRMLALPKSSALVDQGMDVPTVGAFARGKSGGGIDWATPTNAGALSSPVGISDGGTGATTAAGARTNLLIQGTTAQQGVLELATDAETVTGTDVDRATTPSGVAAAIAAAAAAPQFTTGDVKMTLKTVADSGWVLMDDKTIGNGASGATGRANADTADLFELIWDNVIDTWCPVSGGRGGSGAADFAANKTITLPKTLGRALAGYGTGTVVASGTDSDVDIGAANSLTVTSNNTKWITGMAVVFTLGSGTITGLTSGNTYYVIRSSATLVQLASTLANAQNGTAIDLTAKSSPVWTITHTYTARVLGEAIGEQSHAQSLTELLSHTHIVGSTATAESGTEVGHDDISAAGAVASAARGGNVAMNITNPTLYLTVMVKL